MPSTDPWGARGCPEARRATGTLGPGRSPSRQGREAPPCMPDVASATDSLECRFDSVAAVCEEAGRCHQNTSAKARNAHWMSEMLSCLMSTNANTTVCLVVHGRETPGFYTQDNCERRQTSPGTYSICMHVQHICMHMHIGASTWPRTPPPPCALPPGASAHRWCRGAACCAAPSLP